MLDLYMRQLDFITFESKVFGAMYTQALNMAKSTTFQYNILLNIWKCSTTVYATYTQIRRTHE